MDGEFGKLRRAYIADLREAKKIAEAWWEALITGAGDSEGAAVEVQRRWPDGAVSHPRVIGVVIRYMHACDVVNQGRERHEQEPLAHFLMEGIDTRDSQDLMDFTDSLTYWPLNHDAADRPV